MIGVNNTDNIIYFLQKNVINLHWDSVSWNFFCRHVKWFVKPGTVDNKNSGIGPEIASSASNVGQAWSCPRYGKRGEAIDLYVLNSFF